MANLWDNLLKTADNAVKESGKLVDSAISGSGTLVDNIAKEGGNLVESTNKFVGGLVIILKIFQISLNRVPKRL